MAERRVTLDSLDDDGDGIGHDGDLRLHVRGGLPGETLRVAVVHQSPHRREAWARVIELDGPASPDRVKTTCAAFGRCGGCALQHLATPAQHAFKTARVAAALPGATVAPIVAAPARLGWRNRAKFVIGRGKGGLVLGSFAPASHELVDMTGCVVPEPAITALVPAFAAALAPTALPVYDEATRTGELRHLLLRASGSGRVHALVVTRSADARPALTTMAEALVAAHPTLVGVSHQVQAGTGGAILGSDEVVLAGKHGVADKVGPVTLWLGPSAFFQVNRAQAEKLYAHAATQAGAAEGVRIVDLFCGAGGIALTAAARGARVVGVESLASAVDDARRSAERSDQTARAEWIVGDAATGLPAAIAQLGGVDAVIVDPPRKGLSAAARAAIIAAAPARIIYVSCEPGSLGRDVAALVAAGWTVGTVQPFDLMPGTPEVETVVTLTRA